MYDEETILQELHATELSESEQQELLDQVGIRVGEVIEAQLSEQQMNEYKAIVDANQDVIFAWLDQNQPEYKEHQLYKELTLGYEEDPEKIQPEKVVASIGWVEANVPNVEEIVGKVVEAFKQESRIPA